MNIATKKPELGKMLLKIPHNNLDLCVAIFGPNTYLKNVYSMSTEEYFHSSVSFRPATTSESISAFAHGFARKKEVDTKRDILHQEILQLGYVVPTKEGIFTNVSLIEEVLLKRLLKKDQRVNGVYFMEGGVAFAPYETFKQGSQDSETFAKGGLARALEHTTHNTAKNLVKIASQYKRGVYVDHFNEDSPSLRVAHLISNKVLWNAPLGITGVDSGTGHYFKDEEEGYAFGVLNK